MKTSFKDLFLLPVLAAGLGLILAAPASAQTFTTLHSFTGGSEGRGPQAVLVLSGNALYGTTDAGGTADGGTVFAVNTDGTGFTTLYSLTGGGYGGGPWAGLILSRNTLYGTMAQAGGSPGLHGTVFAVNTDGTGFTTLHSFTGGSDGAYPFAGVILSGNTLYGMTVVDGSSGMGTVFAVNTDGTGFTTRHSFGRPQTSGAGQVSSAGLILSGNTLYGTTPFTPASSENYGTVFAVNTDGSGFVTVYSFTGGSDGAYPFAGLTLSSNTLYGTARSAGNSGNGTVFAVNTDGTGFTTLYSFSALASPYGPNSDGANPQAGLILSGNTLYGTASSGGSGGNGTVFAVNTDGTGFTNLHSFTGGSDGANPQAGLILSGNTLYGTAHGGGSSGYGTVFSVTLPGPPQLTIMPSGPYVILAWPTNAAGFTLQSTTDLLSPAAWTPVSPDPVVVNGRNTVTNFISGAQQFYRLSQ